MMHNDRLQDHEIDTYSYVHMYFLHFYHCSFENQTLARFSPIYMMNKSEKLADVPVTQLLMDGI